ncbi:MAG: CYTH domain-containing protein [Deltaproteobacteria bacterium]
MNREIERKFLVVKPPPELNKYPNHRIEQGYIAVTDDLEVRLRKKGDQYYQTVKSDGGLVRREVEIELSRDQFEALWPMTEGKRIEKTRYEIEYEGFLIELDIYSGNLHGLKVAEVEFKTEDQSKTFIPPDWLGAEVTDDKRYKNKYLSLHGIPDCDIS